MMCPQCSHDVTPNVNFCSNCGAKISIGDSDYTPPIQFTGTNIFTDRELNILLEINRSTISGGDKSTVSQTDIDKLFE